jgi:hypothetical protein
MSFLQTCIFNVHFQMSNGHRPSPKVMDSQCVMSKVVLCPFSSVYSPLLNVSIVKKFNIHVHCSVCCPLSKVQNVHFPLSIPLSNLECPIFNSQYLIPMINHQSLMFNTHCSLSIVHVKRIVRGGGGVGLKASRLSVSTHSRSNFVYR